MILDSSAIVAIMREEPGHARLNAAIQGTQRVAMGAPTILETAIVLSTRFGASGQQLLRAFSRLTDLEIVPFDEAHGELAIETHLRFGKGRHPARLNFGDCMTYAVAKLAREPLLCTGDDFAKTDLDLVLPPT